jgi:hypothetical protein
MDPTRHYLLLLLCLPLLCVPAAPHAPEGAVKVSTPEEIKAEFDAVPCKNSERQAAVKALFERMGAAPADIQVGKKGGAENVVIRRPGASPETVIVGAHYDKKSAGCGALDNWTGVVAVAHLYRSLKDVALPKTVLFVAFDREEEGLVGSKAMAKEIKKEDAAQYCAMLNIDSLGLAAPQVMDNISSPKLRDLASETAKKMSVPFGHMSEPRASSDSASFLAKKIPAVTLVGMNNDWPRILHTGEDQAKRVNHESVYLGYRLALAMLGRALTESCGAYR